MENRLVAKGRQGREGRHGRLGLEDGEYYIEDRETKKQTKKTEKQQYPVINSKGKEYEKEYCIYICICITETLCCTTEMNVTYCESATLKQKKKKKRKKITSYLSREIWLQVLLRTH